jgi:hypothetical protein
MTNERRLRVKSCPMMMVIVVAVRHCNTERARHEFRSGIRYQSGNRYQSVESVARIMFSDRDVFIRPSTDHVLTTIDRKRS